jgi:hypothetical protein
MMASHHGTRELLAYLRTASPIILLLVFVVAFVTNSIRTARTVTQNRNAVCTGPGGRPLPKRSRSTMVVGNTEVLSERKAAFQVAVGWCARHFGCRCRHQRGSCYGCQIGALVVWPGCGGKSDNSRLERLVRRLSTQRLIDMLDLCCGVIFRLRGNPRLSVRQ